MNLSFTTPQNPDWNKQIEAGLRKECERLIGCSGVFNQHAIYAHSDNSFAGGVIFEYHRDILWIDSIWVEPHFRKQGTGKMLMQKAELLATQNKIQQIQLNTYFKEAYDFFLICGFEDVATIPNWKYDLECYLMRKVISLKNESSPIVTL